MCGWLAGRTGCIAWFLLVIQRKNNVGGISLHQQYMKYIEVSSFLMNCSFDLPRKAYVILIPTVQIVHVVVYLYILVSFNRLYRVKYAPGERKIETELIKQIIT